MWRSVVVLSPSWPFAFQPQHQAAPALVSPQVCQRPDVIEANVTPPCCTATGTCSSVVVLSPSWPFAFQPQHQAAPALVSPQLSSPPAVIEVNVTPPCCTATGVERSVVVLSPSRPFQFAPQQ